MMRWYMFHIYDRPEPDEWLTKAESEDKAFANARSYWGPDVIIKLKEDE